MAARMSLVADSRVSASGAVISIAMSLEKPPPPPLETVTSPADSGRASIASCTSERSSS